MRRLDADAGAKLRAIVADSDPVFMAYVRLELVRRHPTLSAAILAIADMVTAEQDAVAEAERIVTRRRDA